MGDGGNFFRHHPSPIHHLAEALPLHAEALPLHAEAMLLATDAKYPQIFALFPLSGDGW